MTASLAVKNVKTDSNATTPLKGIEVAHFVYCGSLATTPAIIFEINEFLSLRLRMLLARVHIHAHLSLAYFPICQSTKVIV